MANLDQRDRDLLGFQPDIHFVEPDVLPGKIEAEPDPPQVEDILAKRKQVAREADAVDKLAALLQARADIRAKNMKIKLDPNVDQSIIQAVKRRFPDADSSEITYAQYRECKDDMREAGLSIAEQALVTPDKVKENIDDASKVVTGQGAAAISKLGGFNTEEARTGGLRPELDPDMQIIQPLDIGKLQIDLICIFVNFIWKNFILKVFDFSIAGINIVDEFLPEKLCEPGGDIEAPDIILLGAKIPDIFTQEPPEPSVDIPEDI
jgi:hypothetical protein